MKKIIIVIMLLINITTISYAQSCENLANSLDYLKVEIELSEDKGLKKVYKNVFSKYYEIFFNKCIIKEEK